MFLISWRNIVAVGTIFHLSWGYINLAKGGSSFSSAIKALNYDKLGEEVLLYKGSFDQPGYTTEQWFTGSPFDKNAIIRVYIDDEDIPALEYSLYLCQSVVPGKTNTPWSTRLFGELATNGGVFNTFRIPFSNEIRITLENNVITGYLWYIVRGLVGLSLLVGNFELPINSRLKLYKQDKVLAPLEFITLSDSINKSGFLFLVNFNILSDTPYFMEGCVRAVIDGSNTTTFLSSGTEDFFLSAYYFNRGTYHGFHAGLSLISANDTSTQIVAYKFFIDDPVIFRKSFQLIWRNFETADGPNGCPSQFPPNRKSEPDFSYFSDAVFPTAARIQSYVWVYEWPAS